MSTALRALLLAALLTLVPVGIGVAVSGPGEPESQVPPYASTDLADFDTTTAVVRRAPFCERVARAAVEEALGEGAELTASYGNGETADAVPGGDVAHEYGCTFAATPASTPADGVAGSASAWVFVPPVTVQRATELVAAKPAAGCTVLPDSPAYGTPSVAQLCQTKTDRTVTHRGLFGDAWLTCRLTLPMQVAQDELIERAGRWCVAVAQAASPDS
ncbi:hypothetical protein JK386_13125 [Nocardioides sp. zg-536]|uniref:DUF3558 domain-containing protein n=1 Tax=Nocardioides faecalis TaxID=2803858 RepID=A0A938Y7W4_9ACTN|nr:hypothetical protein [Nocardioides faecalis]MBM9460844.1 hypothetical protein [Nocardioides faecalis]MBS4754707.1 hypothetical protein [Nocardioides faecalis]QVI58031.1 hypothetical protein KG111_13500 [Nocardioides faecalis]